MSDTELRFTRDELVQALKTAPVPGTLTMLEEQGGGPEDLADAIIQALGRVQGAAHLKEGHQQ